MKIACVSPMAKPYEAEPYVIRPDIRVFGHGAYSLMYPKEPFWYVAPSDLGRVVTENPPDLILFNPTSDYEALVQMRQGAEQLRKSFPDIPRICLDGDMASYWLRWYPTITEETVSLFRACDGVFCRDGRQVPFVETLSGAKAAWLPEISSFATFIRSVEGGTRDVILSPTTHCGSFNSLRFAMGNYAVMKRLQEKFPNFAYRVLMNVGSAFVPGLGAADEARLLDLIGLKADLVPIFPGYRYELVKEFEDARLMVNLDFEPAMGHWQLDAAAMGVPVVCSDWTVAGCHLYGWSAHHPYDFQDHIRFAEGILTDEALWSRVSGAALDDVREFRADKVKEKFEGILREWGISDGL